MIDVLIFLQNPWSRVYAGRRWDGASWERALWQSRTGIRLKYLLKAPVPLSAVVRNCNPIATRIPSGCRRPDPVYVKAMVAEHAPKCLLLCGRQAGFVAQMGFPMPFVTMPHPAYRLLTNHALDLIREQLVRCVRREDDLYGIDA